MSREMDGALAGVMDAQRLTRSGHPCRTASPRPRSSGPARSARLSHTVAFRIEALERQIDQYWVEIHKKYAIPAACIIFVLVGAPLGIMARRGGFGIAATLSLGFFVLYWAFLIGGEKLADRAILSPFWGMWGANIIIGAMGMYLTFKVGRETILINWSVFERFIPRRWRTQLSRRLQPRSPRRMKLIDRYIIRQFLVTALFSLVAVLVVFIVIDAMEKMDDFIDKQAGWDIILLYYVYFVPEIIKLIIPVAMLLASLFVTARLSAQGEWTAFKSGGVSLYRLLVPYLARRIW